ncbi:M50 family metallopeptidase [Aureliella helgolandensis]|uniref:Uncharacterized protein n=1 Tax=Aureliella helgolandensis TaxID=2527968 RepID=A0A518G676_9BACT|nr:M50 family metallopeptidase [Aureliella helgolandensis]QDV24087.1 hypothetical protein Q31a_24000 [Aureliella helgolandensis]
MSWPDRIDQLLRRLKWPAAWLSLASTPLLVWGLLKLLLRILPSPLGLLPFVLGTVGFIVVWRRFLRTSRMGRFAMTLEHESTHALFALLCMHRIVGFRASVGRGGEVRFTGKGNWLITAAPYFFPTAAILLFLIAYVLPFPGLPWQSFLLGVALGYHVVSTYRETTRDQPDIQQLGTKFCWMFLPAANLAVVSLLIAFAYGRASEMNQWLSDLSQPVRLLISSMWRLASAT